MTHAGIQFHMAQKDGCPCPLSQMPLSFITKVRCVPFLDISSMLWFTDNTLIVIPHGWSQTQPPSLVSHSPSWWQCPSQRWRRGNGQNVGDASRTGVWACKLSAWHRTKFPISAWFPPSCLVRPHSWQPRSYGKVSNSEDTAFATASPAPDSTSQRWGKGRLVGGEGSTEPFPPHLLTHQAQITCACSWGRPGTSPWCLHCESRPPRVLITKATPSTGQLFKDTIFHQASKTGLNYIHMFKIIRNSMYDK